MDKLFIEDLGRFPDKADVEAHLRQTPLACVSKPLQDLSHYYDMLSKSKGAMPSRSDVDPKHLVKILENIYLVDVLDRPVLGPSSFYYRVLGSRLSSFIGQDLSQKSLAEYKSENRRARSALIYGYVVENKVPARSVGQLTDARGKATLVEAIAFPLSSDGENVNMIIGGLGFI